MADFQILVDRVAGVRDHPNADRLSILKIRGYETISAKLENGDHRYQKDDLVVYVPEGAVVPEYLLKQGFWNEEKGTGMLAGSKGNRVKAIKLRGALSQGIVFPVGELLLDLQQQSVIFNDNSHWLIVKEGDEVSEFLGIFKYEPPIPLCMSGQVASIGIDRVFHFDIENIKKYPDAFDSDFDEPEVIFTEKLHGTFVVVGYDDKLNETFVSSKGQFSKGLVLKNSEQNKDNIYIRMVNELKLDEAVRSMFTGSPHERHGLLESLPGGDTEIEAVYLLGEIFGKGVQDLHYSTNNPVFRAFDIYVRYVNGTVFALPYDAFKLVCNSFKVETVPELYRGAFSHEKAIELTGGRSSIGDNVREGIVIRPTLEMYKDGIGRLVLKSVSEEYLLRKGGTELA